jgi:hypothetical protein
MARDESGVRKCLGVVDQCRSGLDTRLKRPWRLDVWQRRPSAEERDYSGLLTGNIGGRHFGDFDVDAVERSAGGCESFASRLRGLRVRDIHAHRGRIDGESRQSSAFEDEMRVPAKQIPILPGRRLTLLAVDHNVSW